MKDDELTQQMLPTLNKDQQDMLLSPEKYLGTVEEDVEKQSKIFEEELNELEKRIDDHNNRVKYI